MILDSECKVYVYFSSTPELVKKCAKIHERKNRNVYRKSKFYKKILILNMKIVFQKKKLFEKEREINFLGDA